ncbi:MAG TPA: hypothetical protein PKN62_00475 [bacterium]|nr:hypothetical protein [bacterium]
MAKQQEIQTDEEIVTGFGRKLGFLIANLNISSEAKELLVEMFEVMDPEQAVEVAAILEEKFAAEQSEVLDAELELKLEELAERITEQLETGEKMAISEIKELLRQNELEALRNNINK